MDTHLFIGHVSADQTPTGPRLGGTVTFSSLTSIALGVQSRILTSAPDSLEPLLEPLKAASVHRIPSQKPTIFENMYGPEGRRQKLLSRAEPLTITDLPAGWEQAQLVHLAPIIDEVSPEFFEHFKTSRLIVTPQGWMRHVEPDGLVTYKPWVIPDGMAQFIDVIILSIEDVQHEISVVEEYAAQVPLLIDTRSTDGCILYVDSVPQHIPTHPVLETDPTGAGDIFAAAFSVRWIETEDPIQAAHFANAIAGNSVTRTGVKSIPEPEDITEARRQY